jgi:photosynthetic reaction center H subunit
MDDGTVRLCPMTACIVSLRGGEVKVNSIRSDQFAKIPQLKNPDQITFLEEEKICAYIAGGKLYATPDRQEPWL